MLDAIFSWNSFWWILMVFYVPICFALIGIVLLQKGKGVGFAGAFGLGAGSEAIFGPRGGMSLPVRITQVLAGSFMFLALLISLTGGLARRGIAPGTVEATVNDTAGDLNGLQQLEDLGLGSAVGGGAGPAGTLTIDEPEAEDVAPIDDIIVLDEEPATEDTAVEAETAPPEAETAPAGEDQAVDGS